MVPVVVLAVMVPTVMLAVMLGMMAPAVMCRVVPAVMPSMIGRVVHTVMVATMVLAAMVMTVPAAATMVVVAVAAAATMVVVTLLLGSVSDHRIRRRSLDRLGQASPTRGRNGARRIDRIGVVPRLAVGGVEVVPEDQLRMSMADHLVT